jgi:hypothetical protein
MRARWASTTSTDEIAPERIAAAVCTADHCQTDPLGGRAVAGFGAGFFCDVAPALRRLADFVADFFGAFFAPPFRLTTVFFAISRLVIAVRTLDVPRSRVETDGQLFDVE